MYGWDDWSQCLSVSSWFMWEACSENVAGVKVQQYQKNKEEQTVSSLGRKFESLGGTTQTQRIRMWNWPSGLARLVGLTLAHIFSLIWNQTLKSYWILWNFPKKLNFLFLAPGIFHMLLPLHGRHRIVPPTYIPRNHFMWKTFPDPGLSPNTGSGVLFHVYLLIFFFI